MNKKIKSIFYLYGFLLIFSAILLFTPIFFINEYISNVYFRLMIGFGFFATLLWYSYIIIYMNKRFKPNGLEK